MTDLNSVLNFIVGCVQTVFIEIPRSIRMEKHREEHKYKRGLMVNRNE